MSNSCWVMVVNDHFNMDCSVMASVLLYDNKSATIWSVWYCEFVSIKKMNLIFCFGTRTFYRNKFINISSLKTYLFKSFDFLAISIFIVASLNIAGHKISTRRTFEGTWSPLIHLKIVTRNCQQGANLCC